MTLLATVAIILLAFNFEKSEQVDMAIEFALPLLIIVLALVGVCYKTGESPKWMWGSKSPGETSQEVD